jgi:hypothetical protein
MKSDEWILIENGREESDCPAELTWKVNCTPVENIGISSASNL